MADWYVSSAVYSTISAFVASHAYSVNDLVKPTTPGTNAWWTFKCTTAGTSSTEPNWSASASTNNSTVTSGGATFTNVTGQAWATPFGNLVTAGAWGRGLVGDRVFLSSDHAESASSIALSFNNGTAGFGLVQLISVSRAGSVPPVAADILAGASFTASSGNLVIDAYCDLFWQGVTFTGSAANNIIFNSTGTKSQYFKNCAFVLSLSTNSAGRIETSAPGKIVWDNSTVQFSNVSQAIVAGGTNPFELIWLNTLSAIVGATIPTNLFNSTAATQLLVTCRGVDLSAITGTLLNSANAALSNKVLLDSCKIASGVTRFSLASTTASVSHDEIELVNCYDGTNVINERHTPAGDVTIDRATYLSSGAQDDTGHYSFKLVSNARSDFATMPLDCFAFDVENTVTGSSKIATVEIISNASLNNNDIRLALEYMGTSGNPIASFVDSLASVLTATSALSSSSSAWTLGNSAWDASLLQVNNVLSNNNLTISWGTGGGKVQSLNGFSSGKYYFEVTGNTWAGSNAGSGVSLTGVNLAPSVGSAQVVKNGTIYVNNVSSGSSLGARSSGDIIGIAVDLTAQLIWLRVCPSGNWNGSGTANPATATGGISISSISTGALFASSWSNSSGDVATANFGASSFSGAVPSGFISGWPISGPKQLLQVTFTPQRAGRVRGLVRLGKISTTCWVNPQITVT